MRWQGRRQSRQVEDRRGRRVATPRVAAGGCGTIVVVLVIAWLTGADPMALLQVAGDLDGAAPVAVDSSGPLTSSPEDDAQVEFLRVVLADTEETWSTIFAAQGLRYELPTLVLFRDAVESACGLNSAAVGPFYCPGDGKLYLDLAFFEELSARFGAPGDFAQAYVVAHEVGHHVQNLLGIADEVTARQRRARSREESNDLSVRMELQADCLAGVWGFHAAARGLLEPGDVEEGLGAAEAIGDDRLQSRATGRVSPESWTHGSSAMRSRWLRVGLEGGDADACDPFSTGRL